MRNLQKILALALALIMSFSLVVTANAAFSDEADITDTYNEAVNVLSQLEVFKGYTDGTYQPQKSITRAEVAAIIYRIATGDVTDTQVSIYSDWNRFTDVHAGEWWAGYINYCANAEYIKGYGNGKFGPDDPVTGYEALAMILRAVGYGKMDGEFQGSDWAVQTAARANTLKVTKNVQNSALLNSAATRELVAELLFRSILVPTVEYNQFSGYSENDTTLAYQSFGLERIEGVVVANEYANLYDVQILDAGKTDLEETDGTVRHLDITSALTDVGESRYAYIVDSARGAKVLGLEDTGSNVVKETGESTTINTDKKFRDFSGLDKTDDTEFYLNFGREGKFSCDYRLEFTVIFYTKDAQDTFTEKYHDVPAYAYACNTDKDNKDNDWTVRYGTWTQDEKENVTHTYAKGEPGASSSAYLFPSDANSFVEYNRIIRAKEEITSEEMDIIEGIFASADNISSNGLDKDKVTGDVYLGTKSNLDKDDKERDISNEISFRKFKDEYINSQIWDQDIENSGNGEWLKIVDNDNDGKADYAFLTQYWLDKAISSYTKSGETILEFNSVDVEAFEDNDGIIEYVDEIAVNDVVYYTNIDNRITMTKAPVVTAKIKTVNFKDDSCTTTEDTTYVESDIFNKSRLDQEVENLDDEVEYNLYFDAYGYVRAYELAQGNTYGLLTELYKTTTQNAQYVKGVDLTAELKKGAAAIDEFDVSNSKDNVFLLDGIAAKANDNNWNNLHTAVAAIADKWIYKNVYSVDRDSNILLQPAIGQLGLEYDGDARSAGNIFHNATTNVATYIETGDNEVRLTSPVKYATNEKGSRLYYANSNLTGGKYVKGEELSDGSKVSDAYPAYEVDYIALDLSDGLAADARRYNISEQSRYYNQSGKYVNAVHDTEYYVVNTNTQKADYFTDYEKVYAISKDHIISAYAVAQNTVADHSSNDYWVADVIVIEVSGLDTIFDSVGVLYTNPSQTSGSVKLLKTLNTESENPDIDMIPEDWEWAPQNNGNWVYEIDENEVKDGVLYADTIQYIAQNYNAKGIYAGIVSHVEEVSNRGGYIDVVMPGYATLTGTKDASGVSDWVDSVSVNNDQLFAIGSSSGRNYSLRDLRVTRSATTDRVKKGDYVIWGEDKDGHTAFVIDVSFIDGDWKAPTWLTNTTPAVVDANGKITNWAADPGLWYTIAWEQVAIKGATTFKEAMDAYNTWVKDQTEANRTKAVDTINAALKNPKLTDEEKARLEDILDILNASTPSTPGGTTGKLYLEENDYIQVLKTDETADPVEITLFSEMANAISLRTLNKYLKSTVATETVTVVGYDVDGVKLDDAQALTNAGKITATISGANGAKTEYVIIVDTDNSGLKTLTLASGIRAYLDEDHTQPIKSGWKTKDNVDIYLEADGWFEFSINNGAGITVNGVDATYHYSTKTTTTMTLINSNTNVAGTKKTTEDGKWKIEGVPGNTVIIENPKDGTWDTEADYIVQVSSKLDWRALGREADEKMSDGTSDMDNFFTATREKGDSNAANSYFKWSNWNDGQFYFKAAGAYGGEDVRTTFEFFTIGDPSTAATGITAVLGYGATPDDPNSITKYTVTVSNDDKSVDVNSFEVPEGCTVTALYEDDTTSGHAAGAKIVGKKALAADDATPTIVWVEVLSADGISGDTWMVEITRPKN